MKLKDPLEGNCKHGISKKKICEKCWDKMMKESRKKTEKFLKDLDKAVKTTRDSRNSNLIFD
jgi:hypothetical protein